MLFIFYELAFPYQNYPDALARLYGALSSQEGRFIIVDTKPIDEFIEEHSHDHAGGAQVHFTKWIQLFH